MRTVKHFFRQTLLLCLILCMAQLPLDAEAASKKVKNKFTQGTIRVDKKKCVYWTLAPQRVTEQTPLIVFLHGSSERGERALVSGLPAMINAGDVQISDAVVLVPQAPEGVHWVRYQKQLMAVIAEVEKDLGLTDRNLVLAGFSAGATGVWRIVSENPGKFSKALCISGRIWDPVEVKAFKNCDVKVVLGTLDENIPPASAKAFVKKLKKKKYSVEQIEYRANHNELQKLAFRNEHILEWLCAPVEPEMTPSPTKSK